MSRRPPAFAGKFYTASERGLRETVARFEDTSAVPGVGAVAIAPHAGLMYSGHVAGAVYGRLRVPDTVVLIGPNHTGLGPIFSVYPEGSWVIPGSELSIDCAFAEQLTGRFRYLEADETAHRFEHCLEVQLPFLAQARPDVRIVPILVGTIDRDLCKELGRCLAGLFQARPDSEAPVPHPLLVATTDMSHFESDALTRKKDALAIQAIRGGDADALYDTAMGNRITMCGLGPVMVALETARELAATEATLVKYATSGEVNGNLDRVVGYAGFIMTSPAPDGGSSQQN